MLQAKQKADAYVHDNIDDEEQRLTTLSKIDDAYNIGQEEKQDIASFEEDVVKEEGREEAWRMYMDYKPTIHIIERAKIDCGTKERFWLRYCSWVREEGAPQAMVRNFFTSPLCHFLNFLICSCFRGLLCSSRQPGVV